jgi:hypothetical protein
MVKNVIIRLKLYENWLTWNVLMSGGRFRSGRLVFLEFALTWFLDRGLAAGQAHPSAAVLVSRLGLALIARTGDTQPTHCLGQHILALTRSPLPSPLPHSNSGEGEMSAICGRKAEKAADERLGMITTLRWVDVNNKRRHPGYSS